MSDGHRALGRREFLIGWLRTASAAVVATGAALLVLRTTRSPAACTRRVACRQCPQWTGCTLPLAVSTRSRSKER